MQTLWSVLIIVAIAFGGIGCTQSAKPPSFVASDFSATKNVNIVVLPVRDFRGGIDNGIYSHSNFGAGRFADLNKTFPEIIARELVNRGWKAVPTNDVTGSIPIAQSDLSGLNRASNEKDIIKDANISSKYHKYKDKVIFITVVTHSDIKGNPITGLKGEAEILGYIVDFPNNRVIWKAQAQQSDVWVPNILFGKAEQFAIDVAIIGDMTRRLPKL